jgi:hypothetical protein
MTTNGRPMDDATLDALLGDWFAEGATTAPERIADQAMLEVTTAAQERRVLAAIQASVTSAPLAWAAAILVIAISIGLALGTRVVGPSPTPSPIPTDPTAWRSLTFEDQGFVLRLPPAWRSWTTAGGGIVHFVGPSGSFDVRLGADDGRMSVCTMTIALCPSISVDGLGDVNGDGHADLLVGAPGAAGGIATGLARVLSGLDGSLLLEVDGDTADDRFGQAVSGVADLDGDGVPDFIVGAPFDDPGAVTDAGSAYVYSGADGSPLFDLHGSAAYETFGWSVSGLGDMDGDGVPDLIVGAPHHAEKGEPDAGAAFVYSGADGSLLHTLDGANAFDLFGWSVACGEDGALARLAMPIVGAPGSASAVTPEGYARVFKSNGKVANTFHGDSAGDLFGISVDGAGDVDQDGKPDVIVGAMGVDFYGSASGMARVLSPAADAELFSIFGSDANQLLGASVSGAGDVNQDGAADLLIGAPGDGNGRVELRSGASAALLAVLEGDGLNDSFGVCVDAADDVDGDGILDQIVGASDELGEGLNPGRAWVFAGQFFYLRINGFLFDAGDRFEAIALEGVPSDLVIHVVTHVNTTPTFILLNGVQRFDANGTSLFSGDVPKGLSGVRIEFTSFGDIKGEATPSNSKWVAFN